MLAKVRSGAIVGLDAIPIDVEIDISAQGLPSFTIVGLPDKSVEESKERVRSAIKNSKADFPVKKIIVNLAPADLPKEGSAYDLPIAIGILLADGQLQADVSSSLFLGELSLDGSLRSVSGILPNAVMAQQRKIENIFLPGSNAKEATIVSYPKILAADKLSDVISHLLGQVKITPYLSTDGDSLFEGPKTELDFTDIKGQEQAKRALEITATGGHNVLLKGPPGTGKTLLARSITSILPKPSYQEMIEISKIYSIAGLLKNNSSFLTNRPFRSPHHSSSLVAMVGGGSKPTPGEVTLAHMGVLFLDEFAEFPKYVIESLRQPLEDGQITISRAARSLTFPAKFILIAAQNPCPCGFLGHPQKTCICSSGQIVKYQRKISGPVADRIDLHIEMPPVDVNKLIGTSTTIESSNQILKRVETGRSIQARRFKGRKISTNSEMSNKDLKLYCVLNSQSESLLKKAIQALGLSARAYTRVVKVARTIADLDNCSQIMPSHLAEALQYRPQISSSIDF